MTDLKTMKEKLSRGMPVQAGRFPRLKAVARDFRRAIAEELAEPTPCPQSVAARNAGELRNATATLGLEKNGRCLFCGSTECQRAQQRIATEERLMVKTDGLRGFVRAWLWL